MDLVARSLPSDAVADEELGCCLVDITNPRLRDPHSEVPPVHKLRVSDIQISWTWTLAHILKEAN